MELGAITRPFRGETVCGDNYVVVERTGATHIALADGLGHGVEAAVASKAFCDCVESAKSHAPMRLFTEAGERLSKTRGAAAAILTLDPASQTAVFTGVGNVELRAVSRESIRPVSVPGIVGRKVRKIRPMSYPIRTGDLFVLFSDGISTRFSLQEFAHLPCQALAEELLDKFGKYHDDASCVAVRW